MAHGLQALEVEIVIPDGIAHRELRKGYAANFSGAE